MELERVIEDNLSLVTDSNGIVLAPDKVGVIIGGIFSINGDRYKIRIVETPHKNYLWGVNTQDKILYVFNTKNQKAIEGCITSAQRQYASGG